MFKVYKSQDEIPEALREHYVEKDGVWIPETENANSDVATLRRTLDNVRQEHKQFKAKFEDVDLDEYAEMRKQQAALRDKKLIEEGKHEELLKTRLAEQAADFEARIGKLQKQLEGANTEILDFKIMTPAQKAATENGIVSAPGAVDFITHLVKQRFTIENGEIVGRDEQGQLLVNDRGERLGISDYVSSLRPQPEYQPFFQQPKGSGDTPQGNGTGAPVKRGNVLLVAPTPENISRYAEQVGKGEVEFSSDVPA